MNQNIEKPSKDAEFNPMQTAFQELQAPAEAQSRAEKLFLLHFSQQHRTQRWVFPDRIPAVALAGIVGVVLGVLLWPLVVSTGPDSASLPHQQTAGSYSRPMHGSTNRGYTGLGLSALTRIESPSMTHFSLPQGSPGVLPPRPPGTSSLSLSQLTPINEV